MHHAIIIPAHNEAAGIRDCLEALTRPAKADDFAVVVACNGCTDDTADIARSVAADSTIEPQIHVLDLARPGKTLAMNEALDFVGAVTGGIMFLDGDSTLPYGTVQAVFKALAGENILAATTGVTVDHTRVSWLSSAYYRYWSAIPSVRNGLGGRGNYALSVEGLARLGRFPDMVGDDRHVDLLFQGSERVQIPEAATIDAAPTIRELVRRKTRIFRGNRVAAELAANHVPQSEKGQSVVPLREQGLSALPDFVVYVSANLVAKILARRDDGTTSW